MEGNSVGNFWDDGLTGARAAAINLACEMTSPVIPGSGFPLPCEWWPRLAFSAFTAFHSCQSVSHGACLRRAGDYQRSLTPVPGASMISLNRPRGGGHDGQACLD